MCPVLYVPNTNWFSDTRKHTYTKPMKKKKKEKNVAKGFIK